MEAVVSSVHLPELRSIREVEIPTVAGRLVPQELGGGREEDWRGEVGEGSGEKGEVFDLNAGRGRRGGGAVSQFPPGEWRLLDYLVTD